MNKKNLCGLYRTSNGKWRSKTFLRFFDFPNGLKLNLILLVAVRIILWYWWWWWWWCCCSLSAIRLTPSNTVFTTNNTTIFMASERDLSKPFFSVFVLFFFPRSSEVEFQLLFYIFFYFFFRCCFSFSSSRHTTSIWSNRHQRDWLDICWIKLSDGNNTMT